MYTFGITMKLLLLFLGVVAIAYSVPVREAEKEIPRYYDPKEEIEYRQRYILTQDGDGKYHITDLIKERDLPSERATIADVTFYLYTQNNRETPDIIPANDFNQLSRSRFLASRQNVFIAHGWNNNFNSAVNRVIRPAILANNNVNLFVVDWSRPANLFYTAARDAVVPVGNFVGDFINRMMSSFNLGVARFNLIGHSLGAHVVGNTGARVNGRVNSIVGLDPAGPLFTSGNTANRIDPTDGAVVQIIHTNSGLLGFSGTLGHADYRPNGGRSQPGCGIDIAGTCAHGRAYDFYAESVRTGRFVARRCGSMADLNAGRCNNNHQSFMGQFNIDRTASGDYFLATNDRSPFARG